MQLLRPLIAALLVLSVAVAPAAAAIVPCCCTDQEVQRTAAPCCAEQQEPACCAATNQSTVELTTGCCCIEPLTAPIGPRESLASQADASNLQAFAAVPVPAGIAPAGNLRLAAQAPGLAVPSHPPLSVLYCVWLK